ncbi:DEAD-box ATP-dependent RNA helicase 24 isoform X1 [Capsicum annuum]|uniref:DEAD-box ATP-dependent RNA helicase 24 isoform X1 n=1 Tax=Capsicum annuum TaxID=4072 RepID=UPI001FB19051|nr:DEAD-box ATP-dependent RNA helicase 24 isoform X1 [Capsicum annuum]XP_047254058.1 DEAD-box ATP-dependent RNA helicase 24 isoform X1 [Capsicum annuum]XP_047254059.1 DEAD-box ATP-dependent RNA helicase 24 isoform X1 [Capsicum annuum]XP_047254060.1 DEAD-box ATP-dependent RNA helicase 24 isoform X1 [Capsicum annuum]XP_047254061.1 DEAD-box ATP-dependent RNA helicase 24 isoform X1 [Capsicum annuum]XP_047254062.1 DEAD-box ATP-dependent RNA helicase 24 isoform X1 [Capsicum annuum]
MFTELGEQVEPVTKMGQPTLLLLISYMEARFTGEQENSLVAAGQNVSMELMDHSMKVYYTAYIVLRHSYKMGGSGPKGMQEKEAEKGQRKGRRKQ